jgi:ribulose-5-phosphate 4-epimerase/fuculose-1-phosphate aldolase
VLVNTEMRSSQGLNFKLIQPEDLLLVDDEGNILEESGPRRLLNVPAFMIHVNVHAARPDVVCAAHGHSPYGKTFGALGCELDMISQDVCCFYNVSQSWFDISYFLMF